MGIELKSEWEIARIRQAAKIASEIADRLKEEIKPGMSTKKLDQLAVNLIKEYDAKPAFLGYQNYPATICISLNEEVVHGIPNEKKLIKEGDLVSLDLGVCYQGFYGDVAFTVGVGEIKEKAKKLITVAEDALKRAIKETKVGKRIGDISSAIQSYVEDNGFSVVRNYSGHGIGRELHEEPQIPCFGQLHTGARLLAGMVLALETMVNEGTWKVKILPDRWTAVTADGLLSAHFEQMVLVNKNGPEVLT
jgi:methionyl aminopeptidase